jgi:hypothetical protein
MMRNLGAAIPEFASLNCESQDQPFAREITPLAQGC